MQNSHQFLEQLENRFWARVELDKTILKILGFSEREINEWLPKIYDALVEELKVMEKVVKKMGNIYDDKNTFCNPQNYLRLKFLFNKCIFNFTVILFIFSCYIRNLGYTQQVKQKFCITLKVIKVKKIKA